MISFGGMISYFPHIHFSSYYKYKTYLHIYFHFLCIGRTIKKIEFIPFFHLCSLYIGNFYII